MKAGDLDRRIGALGEVVGLARGRLPATEVEAAHAVVERAGQRLGLGLEATVVALAGPTGAGKSTLFNALAGAALTSAGRRRPTTATATAAVWGDGAAPLLDWLVVPSRHRLDDAGLDGLVLLDLPDFDSVELDHRLEVDRVVGVADLVVWVVDPQKYADGALHERYLRQLAGYGEAMLVVLNQSDLLDADALEACRADLAKLLLADGLANVSIVATSADRGDGIAELRALLADRVRTRESAIARLSADVSRRAAALDGGCDGPGRPRLDGSDRERLVDALADSAGVPTVTSAVERAHRRRGVLTTGWPFSRWLRRLRPDPLRRLHLPDHAGDPGTTVGATSLPTPTPVARAQASSAARALAAGAAEGLLDPWPRLLREAAIADEPRLHARLDAAIAGADLHMTPPRWWVLAGLAQRLVAAIVVAGAIWLLAMAALGLLRIEDALPLPEVEGIPIPTAMLIGGVVLGLLLTLLTRWLNATGARRRAKRARRELRGAIEVVGDELVAAPVEAELKAREQLCAALARCGAPSSRRVRRRRVRGGLA